MCIRDRAGEVTLTGAFHVEDADASSTAAGHYRTGSRRRVPRGSDASSVGYYGRQKATSAQLTPVAVHSQQSPPASRSTPTGSGVHLSVGGSARYWSVKTEDCTDEARHLADL